jgi:hypothetical protein
LDDWIYCTYTQDSELSVITVPPLITVHYSTRKASPSCCIFTSRSLAMASNSKDSSDSRTEALPSPTLVQNCLPASPSIELDRHVFSASFTELNCTQYSTQSYVTADGQSASLSWNKALIWDLRPDFYYCQTVAGLLMWDSLSDERTGLSFRDAAGPRQRSHSRVRVPWCSWPYCIVSDSRLPFSSPPTTHRATVEVFDPTSALSTQIKVKVTLRLTVSQSVSYGLVFMGRPL